jgi:hypothetical protein
VQAPKCDVHRFLLKEFNARIKSTTAGLLLLPGTEGYDLINQRQAWQARIKLKEHIDSCEVCTKRVRKVPFIGPII